MIIHHCLRYGLIRVPARDINDELAKHGVKAISHGATDIAMKHVLLKHIKQVRERVES